MEFWGWAGAPGVAAVAGLEQPVGERGPGLPGLGNFAGREGEGRSPPRRRRVAAGRIARAPGRVAAVEIAEVERGDRGVGDEGRAASRQVAGRERREVGEQAGPEVDRTPASRMMDRDGYQTTSPGPSRWLVRRASVKSRSESRLR